MGFKYGIWKIRDYEVFWVFGMLREMESCLGRDLKGSVIGTLGIRTRGNFGVSEEKENGEGVLMTSRERKRKKTRRFFFHRHLSRGKENEE